VTRYDLILGKELRHDDLNDCWSRWSIHWFKICCSSEVFFYKLTVKAWVSLIWISIIIFQDILYTLCRLSKTLQRSDITLGDAHIMLTSTVDLLELKRNRFLKFLCNYHIFRPWISLLFSPPFLTLWYFHFSFYQQLKNLNSNMTAYISSTSKCRYISTIRTCALKLSIGNKNNII
jgi:hypothetical protein